MHAQGETQGPVSRAEQESAARIRRELECRRTLMVNLISSPGSGKTALLEAAISRLKGRFRLAAVEGDVAADLDAVRLCKLGIPAREILTGGACYLQAREVEREIGDLGREPVDIIFVENVGNLVCPAAVDLGEDFKLALLSVVEGDEIPFKYPAAFSKAALIVITKADLLPHVEFDFNRVRDRMAAIQPGVALTITSARTGEGLDAWCRWLADRLEDKRRGHTEPSTRDVVAQISPTA